MSIATHRLLRGARCPASPLTEQPSADGQGSFMDGQDCPAVEVSPGQESGQESRRTVGAMTTSSRGVPPAPASACNPVQPPLPAYVAAVLFEVLRPPPPARHDGDQEDEASAHVGKPGVTAGKEQLRGSTVVPPTRQLVHASVLLTDSR